MKEVKLTYLSEPGSLESALMKIESFKCMYSLVTKIGDRNSSHIFQWNSTSNARVWPFLSLYFSHSLSKLHEAWFIRDWMCLKYVDMKSYHGCVLWINDKWTFSVNFIHKYIYIYIVKSVERVCTTVVQFDFGKNVLLWNNINIWIILLSTHNLVFGDSQLALWFLLNAYLF